MSLIVLYSTCLGCDFGLCLLIPGMHLIVFQSITYAFNTDVKLKVLMQLKIFGSYHSLCNEVTLKCKFQFVSYTKTQRKCNLVFKQMNAAMNILMH